MPDLRILLEWLSYYAYYSADEDTRRAVPLHADAQRIANIRTVLEESELALWGTKLDCENKRQERERAD